VRLRIFHTIQYRYPVPVSESHNEVRLMPLSDDDQTCLDFRLTLTPPAEIRALDLPSGRVHDFDIRAPHSELVIHAESLVVTNRQNPFSFLPPRDGDAEFYQRERFREENAPFLAATERVQLHPEVDRIAATAHKQASGAGTVPFLMALTRQLYRVLTYAASANHVDPSIMEVLEDREGVVRDFTHLMLAICRRQGIPARYVSGYLFTGENAADRREPGQGPDRDPDAPRPIARGSAMHGWVECLLPDNRWHGFDPMNNLLTNDYYVKVHTGRDSVDVQPSRGMFRGAPAHTSRVTVRVVSDPV
jgi:transglutaminase-like putative cysteine protease